MTIKSDDVLKLINENSDTEFTVSKVLEKINSTGGISNTNKIHRILEDLTAIKAIKTKVHCKPDGFVTVYYANKTSEGLEAS